MIAAPQTRYVLSPEALRSIEEQARLKQLPLMQRAGAALCAHIVQMVGEPRFCKSALLIAVGSGNNGGDALVAALLLHQQSYPVRVWLTYRDHGFSQHPIRVTPQHQEALEAYINAGGITAYLEAWPQEDESFLLIVDGLFGIGGKPKAASSLLSSHWQTIIAHINALSYKKQCPIIAVDIPSGLNADTGQSIFDEALKTQNPVEKKASIIYATATLSMIAHTPGHFMMHGGSCCGALFLEPLGLEKVVRHVVEDAANSFIRGTINTPDLWMDALPRRGSDFHKGKAGDVMVFGGQAPYRGAGVLCSEAALMMGCGRVFWADGEAALTRAEIICGYPDTIKEQSCIVVGPGLGTQKIAFSLMEKALLAECPVVMDADALQLLATHPFFAQLAEKRRSPLIITPHPLEAAKLLGLKSAAEVQNNRLSAALQLAKKYHAIVVLKGSGTVIVNAIAQTTPHKNMVVIQNGDCHALSTAGSGDVLAGALGSLIAQGMGAYEAALAAVYFHLRAGQSIDAKHNEGPRGMMAQSLSPAMRKLYNQWCSI